MSCDNHSACENTPSDLELAHEWFDTTGHRFTYAIDDPTCPKKQGWYLTKKRDPQTRRVEFDTAVSAEIVELSILRFLEHRAKTLPTPKITPTRLRSIRYLSRYLYPAGKKGLRALVAVELTDTKTEVAANA